MRGRLGLAAILALSGFCCSTVSQPKKEMLPPTSLRLAPRFPTAIHKVITLHDWKRDSYGMGCPFTPELAFTAGHLAVGDHVEAVAPNGATAHLKLLAINREHDLALLGGSLVPAPLAKEAPAIGDHVYYRGMLLSGQQTAMEGLVLGETPEGDLVIDGWGAPGMSGSCVFNEKGETVAVMKQLNYTPERVVRTMSTATSIVEVAGYLLRRENESTESREPSLGSGLFRR